MEAKEIKQLLQRYFKGESTLKEEQQLKEYFLSKNIAEELKDYSGYFTGIYELTNRSRDIKLENEIMDFIMQNEPAVKSNNRRIWQNIAGIAASVLILTGITLFIIRYEKKPFQDTFNNPETAYAYAEQTLEYISEKYNKGLVELSNFDKLESAAEPFQNNIDKVNKYMEILDNH